MEGKWTFADLLDKSWDQDVYDTKEEAIDSAKRVFDEGCYVGQLHQPYYEFSKYEIVNQDKVIFESWG